MIDRAQEKKGGRGRGVPRQSSGRDAAKQREQVLKRRRRRARGGGNKAKPLMYRPPVASR